MRGIAVSAVIAYHALVPGSQGGFLGVTVFFGLSGFLITYLLCREIQQTGSVRLRSFYLRRVLRLLPALLFLALVIMVYGLVALTSDQLMRIGEKILGAIFYVTNWMIAFGHWPKMGLFAHTWSLSIEEQFYSLWPLLLLFMLRGANRLRALFAVIAGLFLTSAAFRAYHFATNVDYTRPYYSSESNADLLLGGCAVGVMFAYGMLPKTAGARTALRVASGIAAAYIGASLVGAWVASPYMYYGGFSVIAIATAITVAGVLVEPEGLLARILAFPPFVAAGKISYGLYLWHVPAILLIRLHFQQQLDAAMLATAQIVATFALATFSYYTVEVYFLRLKDRIYARRT